MVDALVDERGELYQIAAPAIEPRREPSGIDDLVAQAIYRDGHIYLHSIGSHLLVVFRPRLVGRETIIGACFEICRQRPRRLALSYSSRPMPPEPFADVEAAMVRMTQLAADAQRTKPKGIRSCRLTIDDVESIDGTVMSEMLDAWYATERRWTIELYGRFRDAGLLRNAVIVRQPAGSTELRIEHWGRERDLFGPKWVREARGRQMEEQPYGDLALWAARLYREAIASAYARLDLVSVSITTKKGEKREKTYSRLLLPWRGEDNEAFALTLNVPGFPKLRKRGSRIV